MARVNGEIRALGLCFCGCVCLRVDSALSRPRNPNPTSSSLRGMMRASIADLRTSTEAGAEEKMAGMPAEPGGGRLAPTAALPAFAVAGDVLAAFETTAGGWRFCFLLLFEGFPARVLQGALRAYRRHRDLFSISICGRAA